MNNEALLTLGPIALLLVLGMVFYSMYKNRKVLQTERNSIPAQKKFTRTILFIAGTGLLILAHEKQFISKNIFLISLLGFSLIISKIK